MFHPGGLLEESQIIQAYAASKAALNAMTQSLAQSLAPHHIQCMAVAPGFVMTEMTEALINSPEGEAIKTQSPFNRVAKPEEVANAILYLSLPRKRYFQVEQF